MIIAIPIPIPIQQYRHLLPLFRIEKNSKIYVLKSTPGDENDRGERREGGGRISCFGLNLSIFNSLDLEQAKCKPLLPPQLFIIILLLNFYDFIKLFIKIHRCMNE